MAHGMSDFGVFTPKETTFNLADMADLAVRLGSVVEFDRRGDVIFIDDYESPLPRFISEGDAGCSANLNTEGAKSGSQSLKILLDATIDHHRHAEYTLTPMVLGKHGMKISASLYGIHVNRASFDIYWSVYTGSNIVAGGVQLIPKDGTIAYYDPDGELVIFEENFLPVSAWSRMYHDMKLVFDLETSKYVRFLFDIRSWDMSNYSCSRTPDTTAPQHFAFLDFTNLTAAIARIWLDDFVYTINEP